MRVMLDTNVLISAIVFPNDKINSLIYKATIDYQLVLSSYIIDELFDVIKRKLLRLQNFLSCISLILKS